ncbi:hypothetical protein D9M72_568790 [compost metagenome]
MAEELVVDCGERFEQLRFARRVESQGVAVGGHGGRLIDGDPAGHAVAKGRSRNRGKLAEPVRRVPVQPAAGLVERQRGVPVVERHHG